MDSRFRGNDRVGWILFMDSGFRGNDRVGGFLFMDSRFRGNDRVGVWRGMTQRRKGSDAYIYFLLDNRLTHILMVFILLNILFEY